MYLLLYVCVFVFSWVFMHEKGHQLRDTGIESAVMTKVKGLGNFSNRVMDVADYVVPSQVSKCTFRRWNIKQIIIQFSFSSKSEVNLSVHFSGYFNVLYHHQNGHHSQSDARTVPWGDTQTSADFLIYFKYVGYTYTLSLYSSFVCQTDNNFKCSTDAQCIEKLGSHLGNGEFVLFLRLTSLSGLLILKTLKRVTL